MQRIRNVLLDEWNVQFQTFVQKGFQSQTLLDLGGERGHGGRPQRNSSAVSEEPKAARLCLVEKAVL